MIDFISGLLGSIIRVIFNVFGHNYFVALLIFTLLTKLLLFPLMLKQLKSTASIQKIAPEDKKLREKYKDNPQKLNEELTKLYTENKISPLGGCLIPLIQIPIILAMFFVRYSVLFLFSETPFFFVWRAQKMQKTINNRKATGPKIDSKIINNIIATNGITGFDVGFFFLPLRSFSREGGAKMECGKI